MLNAAHRPTHLAASMRTRWILYTAEVTGSATVSTASDTKRFSPNSGDTRDFWNPSAWRQTCTAIGVGVNGDEQGRSCWQQAAAKHAHDQASRSRE